MTTATLNTIVWFGNLLKVPDDKRTRSSVIGIFGGDCPSAFLLISAGHRFNRLRFFLLDVFQVDYRLLLLDTAGLEPGDDRIRRFQK